MDPGTLRAFEERFGCRVLEAYGLTETCATAAANQPDRPSRPGSIGTPSWGVEMRIVDGDLKELSAGEVGEITVRGLNLMDGYHGNPEATAEAITPDGWFLTGDLGRTDEEGCFYVVDRKKDLIIRGGYNVYPREVEDVLYGHPDVVHVCVLGVPHPELGEEVAAAVVPRPGARPDPEELKAFAREHLAAFKYPRVVALFEQLPVGPTGKVLRRAVDKDELLCRAAGGAVGSEGSPDQQGQGRGR
jgi:long-chain acyl-CoA synthetase